MWFGQWCDSAPSDDEGAVNDSSRSASREDGIWWQRLA